MLASFFLFLDYVVLVTGSSGSQIHSVIQSVGGITPSVFLLVNLLLVCGSKMQVLTLQRSHLMGKYVWRGWEGIFVMG